MIIKRMTVQEYLDATANSTQAIKIRGDKFFQRQRKIYSSLYGFDIFSDINPYKDRIILEVLII